MSEPWQMTKNQFMEDYEPSEGPQLIRYTKNGEREKLTYFEAYKAKLINKKQYDKRFGGLNEKQAKIMLGSACHRNSVWLALQEGKSVSPHVLADYPEWV